MKINNKGFTLIEILVALGLSSLIISLVISFFIINLKNYKKINNEIELQFQAQYIFNFMTDKIMESKNISLVRKDDLNLYSLTYIRPEETEIVINKISFKYGESSSENYVFHLVNNNIRYGRGDKDIKPTVELGSFVKYMYITLLRKESFGYAKVIKIKLVLEKDDETYEASQVAYMRNN